MDPAKVVEKVKSKSGEDVLMVPLSKLEPVSRQGRKRRNGFIFGLGGLFGILLAAFFAERSDMIHLANLPDLADLNLESLAGVLPAGLMKDAKELSVSWSEPVQPRTEGLRGPSRK